MVHYLWILPSLIASSICLFLSIRIWRQRKSPATRALYWILISVFIWAFCQFLILFVDDFVWIVALAKIQYIGIVSTPIAWFTLSMIMLDKTSIIHRQSILTLCIIPTITLLLIFTNEFHLLVWSDVQFIPQNIIPIKVSHGSWFTIHTFYSYLLVSISSLLACISYVKGNNNLLNSKIVFFAPLLVLVTNVIYLQNWTDVQNIDFTPLGFSFSLLLFSWAILKQNLMQIVPIARSTLFEKIEDSILVLDQNYRIVDINTSAINLFSFKSSAVLGTLFSESDHDKEMLDLALENNYSEIIRDGKHLQALRTKIQIDTQGTQGFLLVFRDISELKRTQNNLLEAQLELKKANKALEKSANTDVLTGLHNRRYFFNQFSAELIRSQRHSSDFCFMILDLDHFKNINDTHGHLAGDEVLKRVATLIKQTVRNVDFFSRIGGEEFAILLTETKVSGAQLFAERLCLLIKESHTNTEIPVTTSIGLTQNILDDSVESMFDRADKALYQSKENGRDKFTVG